MNLSSAEEVTEEGKIKDIYYLPTLPLINAPDQQTKKITNQLLRRQMC